MTKLVRALPRHIPAALFVVFHIPAPHGMRNEMTLCIKRLQLHTFTKYALVTDYSTRLLTAASELEGPFSLFLYC
jgi:hypothetical protein